jgi:hypothetical protein
LHKQVSVMTIPQLAEMKTPRPHDVAGAFVS